MIKVQITQKQTYKVTQDYRLLEIADNYSDYSNERNFRYQFEILSGSYSTMVTKGNNLIMRTLRIEDSNGHQINSLSYKDLRYEFVTMDLFNHYEYLHANEFILHEYRNNKLKTISKPFTKEAILEILVGFDSYVLNGVNTTEDLNQSNLELHEENKKLKLLIKDLKRRINQSIKGLRK